VASRSPQLEPRVPLRAGLKETICRHGKVNPVRNLKLSLVSCPIALYTATSSGERVAFRQINKKTGNRLRQQLIDEETGDPIDPDDKGRGYEVDKGVCLRVEEEEIEAIAIESSHTIDIDSFVPKSEIDERYVEKNTAGPLDAAASNCV
jgi:Ku protein